MKKLILIFAVLFLSTVLKSQDLQNVNFSESELRLKTATGNIYGTLSIPETPEPSPIILIIAGSGPTDRDCNSAMGLKTNAFKMMAKEFAANGISTLRFDKRGIAESKAAMKSEADLRFDDYINDVVEWIALLKTDPRFSRIIILGHSEGSLIGMIAAEQTKIAAYISISGAGRAIDEVLKEQLASKLPPQLMEESNRILDTLKMGKTVSEVNPYLVTLYRPSVQPYMISWLKYDPAKEIKILNIPALIIQGTTDLQVSEKDAKLLAAAKPDAKLLIIENMNHVLKEADSDPQKNMATYYNPELPLKSGLVDEIVKFVNNK
ncbi:MAG: alpha/beta hydrolase [Bacteroidetes bacterium HGW-Bacteroidetes-17]|nr:MAG: alpha/beta hydrolase [Bacteroidetes bacterium HGW-Bacteroidetes-17]